jgi:hypothetical protein
MSSTNSTNEQLCLIFFCAIVFSRSLFRIKARMYTLSSYSTALSVVRGAAETLEAKGD